MALGEHLAQALAAALRALDRAGLDHVVVGGVALNLLRRVRATRDLDILVVARGTDFDALRSGLREEGFAHQNQADEIALDDGRLLQFWWPLRDLRMSVKVDVIVGGLPFHAQVLARQLRIEALGTRIPIATVEDVILLKLLAGRPIDVADATELYAIHESSVDGGYLERNAAALGVEAPLAQVRRRG